MPPPQDLKYSRCEETGLQLPPADAHAHGRIHGQKAGRVFSLRRNREVIKFFFFQNVFPELIKNAWILEKTELLYCTGICVVENTHQHWQKTIQPRLKHSSRIEPCCRHLPPQGGRMLPSSVDVNPLAIKRCFRFGMTETESKIWSPEFPLVCSSLPRGDDPTSYRLLNHIPSCSS